MTTKNAEFVVDVIIKTVLENEAYFSELDGVVGDGDFGYSIARGFEKVRDQWDMLDHSLPGNFFKKIGMVIVSAVGGVSGTIWGTSFMRAGAALGTKPEITREDVVPMFRAAIEGIKVRGQSDVGDKTLLDALVPAVDTLEKAFAEGKETKTALAEAAVVARQSAEATRSMLAKRGRAAYTGERSIGTLDAGAIAMAVLFEAVSDSWV
ncbi:MAG TPA: dihydroxyacetone kinase subunit DhaL [Anaerolineaceae bacterium]|nr:dihydroxyacetone kinase subunit DhaL [Anaerolineaceae bacterium]